MQDRLLKLEWSVRALAQPAQAQRRLYPAFVCVADELALEFDECLRLFSEHERASLFTQLQAAALARLDSELAAMSGPAHPELWTDDALDQASEWRALRDAARAVLAAMGWADAPPPAERAIYVGSDA